MRDQTMRQHDSALCHCFNSCVQTNRQMNN